MGETKTEPQLLIDTMTFKAQVLEDNRSRGGKLIARGEFARANLATENKRVYPRTLWERELGRIGKQIREHKVFGELDHPMDGRTQLKRSSHILTGLHLDGDVVMGEAEIMDTQEGKNLKAILESGGRVGVSSRGFGTTRPNMKGEDVVQNDYRLMTFDFVAEPANVTSYPDIHNESTGETQTGTPMSEDMNYVNLKDLKDKNPALYENLRSEQEREFELRGAEIWAKKITGAKSEAATDLRSQFSQQLREAIEDVRSEIAEQEKSKLLSDPSVAGAKMALEGIKDLLRPYVIPTDVESVVREKEIVIEDLHRKMAEQELRLAKLTEENGKLMNAAKEAGYRFHLEKLVGGMPQADLIRKLVGDVKQYESVDDVNGKVAAIVEEIQGQVKNQQRRDHEVDRLKLENTRLRKASEKSLEANNLLAVEKYVEQRLANHPRAPEIRAVMESTIPTSKESVDQILSKFRDRPRRDTEELHEARLRVRQIVGSGAREYDPIVEEHGNQYGANGSSRNGADYNGVGMPISELRALAGIPKA